MARPSLPRASSPKPISWTSSSSPATTTSPAASSSKAKRCFGSSTYPQNLFHDDDDEKRETRDAAAKDAKDDKAQEKKPSKEKKDNDKEAKLEQDIERKMNKTALVSLWIDPAEHQIVKYTFDNVWMDFLPGGWLVRVDDIRASMTMGQPFPGVWLPRNLSVHAGVSLANGAYEATYARAFSNYKLADVKTRITIPKDDRSPDRSDDDPRIAREESPYANEADVHGPRVLDNSEDDASQQAEVVDEIRVHGNVAIADDDVYSLRALTIGQTLQPDALSGHRASPQSERPVRERRSQEALPLARRHDRRRASSCVVHESRAAASSRRHRPGDSAVPSRDQPDDVPADPELRRRLRLHLRRPGQHDRTCWAPASGSRRR